MDERDLTDVKGVGASTTRTLAEAGIDTVAALSRIPLADLAALPGFGPARAATVKASAERLAEHAGDPVPAEEEKAEASSKKQKKIKRNKRDKKGKKEKKEKQEKPKKIKRGKNGKKSGKKQKKGKRKKGKG